MNLHRAPRRRFLQLAVVAPLAFQGAVTAQFAPLPQTRKARFTPTLNAYSFLEQLNANLVDPMKGIDLFGVGDFCVQHDIEAIDLTGYFFPGYPQAPTSDYIARIKRYTHDRGITISGTGVKNDFATADKAVRASGVELTKRWIEVAARLGAPVLRVFAGPTATKDTWQIASGNAPRTDVESWMADDLRTCAEYGEKFGVIIAVQNHGDFSAQPLSTSAFCSESIMHGAERSWIRVNT